MYTEHRLIEKDSRGLIDLKENSIDLVVTSPPYPMIEMWDNLFSSLNSNIGHSLEFASIDEKVKSYGKRSILGRTKYVVFRYLG
ncbi:MAG: hypothetical protein Q7J85_12085 [Bacillota bacterium]|nr:hypothetical protein [Bacillota bacterium]